MKTLLAFFIFITQLSGVLCDPQLVQSDPVLVNPGASHTLTCKGSGYNFGNYDMNWIRQISGGQLQWLAYINGGGGTVYLDSVKGRFTISRDNSNSMLNLQMNNMTPDDTAVYYCARPADFDIWGQGTMVTVTSAAPSAPSLFPLISCDTSRGAGVTLGCLAKDFLPELIDFSWTDQSNKSFSEGFKKYSSMLQPGGTYAATSQITVPSNSWERRDPFYCVAKHSQNTKTVELVKGKSPDPRTPIVTIHPPMKDDLDAHRNGTIVCIASKYFPKPVEVRWMKNNEPLALDVKTEEADLDGNGDFTTTSFITVSKIEWESDTTFSCQVKHPASGFTDMRNTSKSLAHGECQASSSDISVYAIPPSYEQWYFEKNAPLTCIISNMATSDGLEVSWYANNEPTPLPTKLSDPEYYDNYTFTITATSTVCPDDWNKKTFECKVKHPSLAVPKQATLKKENGGEKEAPKVYLFPPHPEELNKKETATLTCMLKDFYPADAFVRWLDESSKILTDNIITTGAIKDKDNYFMYSKLTIKASDWNAGKKYTCMAGHEELPLGGIQRTIDKSAGKPSSVNVTLVMSDSSC